MPSEFDPIQMLVDAVTKDFDRPVLNHMLKALRNQTVARTKSAYLNGEREHPYDVAVGGHDNPYMRRWWLLPRRKYPFNIYLHHFLRSDDDRALHDHPWWNISVLIEGSYYEHVPAHPDRPAGLTRRLPRAEGDIVYRPSGTMSHRIELLTAASQADLSRKPSELVPVWTLFITGPKEREWGFWCKKGWVDWKTFTGQDDSAGPVTDAKVEGPGCGDE